MPQQKRPAQGPKRRPAPVSYTHLDVYKRQHHALARRAAAESIVLLKNENDLLPLAEGAKVAVIGDFAKTPRYQGAGSSAVNSIKVDTFLDCLKESGLASVGFAPGFDRQGKPDAAKQAEAVALAPKEDVYKRQVRHAV